MFLEDLGYSLAAEPELSLKSYVSFATLAPVQPLFYLGNSETPLQISNYISMLKCLEGHGVVSRVEMAEGTEGLEYEADLYKVQA